MTVQNLGYRGRKLKSSHHTYLFSSPVDLFISLSSVSRSVLIKVHKNMNQVLVKWTVGT